MQTQEQTKKASAARIAHTPGPWEAVMNVPTAAIPGHIIYTADDIHRPIALLWEGGGTHGKPTQVANARLIGAAPDLLEACKALLGIIHSQVACVDSKFDIGIATARAAIAKAEGRQP